MTVLCAYTDGHITWIGSDTVGITNTSEPLPCGKKWFGAHGWAFGHCGDAMVSNLFEDQADTLFGGIDSMESPIAEFVRRVRAMYREAGMQPVTTPHDALGNWHNSGILATAGRVWDVDGALAVTPISEGYLHARGCAMMAAKAAAWGYWRANWKASPEVLIEVALAGAARFDVNIRGKWTGRLVAGAGPVQQQPAETAAAE